MNNLGKYKTKQDEVTKLLISLCIEIFLMGYVIPAMFHFTKNDLPYIILQIVFGHIILIFILIHSNKSTYTCYKLAHSNGTIVKGKVERERVISHRYSTYLFLWVRILETGECFRWKESYANSIFSVPATDVEISRFLLYLPEVDVLIDPTNHKMNYVILESIMADSVRQNQNMYRICNFILVGVYVVCWITVLWLILFKL